MGNGRLFPQSSKDRGGDGAGEGELGDWSLLEKLLERERDVKRERESTAEDLGFFFFEIPRQTALLSFAKEEVLLETFQARHAL